MRTITLLAMFVALSLAAAAASAQATQLVIVSGGGTISDTAANTVLSAVSLEAQDGGGTLDAAYNTTINVSITTGTGTLGGTTTAVTMTNGVASFADLEINTVGAKVLTFVDQSGTPLTSAASNSFNITADRLVFTTGPATTTAGVTMASVIVEAQDGLSNTDANFTGTITLSIATGTGTLNGTLGVAATAGVSTFSTLSINEAGAFTLDADSGALTTGTSGSFSINPDVDAAVVFVQQPTNVIQLVAISPAITVQFQDQFGNNTTSTANVTLSINNNPGGSTLGGTATVAAVSGLATFSTITLDNTGTGYTLDADSGALTGATSSAFDVTGNAAPTFTVMGGGGAITNAGSLNVLTGSTVAAANISITVNDASTGDALVLTAGITNQGTTGIVIAEWQGSSTSPTAINAAPSTGTFNTAATLAVTLTANDGVNPAVNFTFDIVVSASPTITVTAPNGGENLSVGANFNVTWTSSGVGGTVDILISTNSGGTFPTSLATATANDGTETLTVPNNPGTTTRIRVRDNATGLILDDSDANFTISTPAPAAVTMSASGNPGGQNANPGSTKTALGFRLAETGGSGTFTVTSVTARVTTVNNTGGVAVAAISSIALRRGGTVLGTATSGTWSVVGNVVTVNFTGLSSAITAGAAADFALTITFAGSSVPSPNPRYNADIAVADVNGGTAVSGAPVAGGTITLVESLPGDPLDEDKTDDSCNLATQGGPAWPIAMLGLLVAIAAVQRRRRTV